MQFFDSQFCCFCNFFKFIGCNPFFVCNFSANSCSGCSGCADPKQELMALMKYMVGHNTAHANELAQLAKQLQDLGENAAYEQIMLAVSDFEKGNLRLSTVLTSMNG